MRYSYFVFLLTFVGCNLTTEKVTISPDDVLYIYDGDTFTIKCIDGYQCNKKGNIIIRVKSVDTPEIKGQCKKERELARKAKKFVVGKIRSANELYLKYDISNLYDRYGRMLAEVYINNIKLSSSLIQEGLGRDYHGGKRSPWCD